MEYLSRKDLSDDTRKVLDNLRTTLDNAGISHKGKTIDEITDALVHYYRDYKEELQPRSIQTSSASRAKEDAQAEEERRRLARLEQLAKLRSSDE